MPRSKVKINGAWVDVGIGTPIDTTPTLGSINAVQSGGTYTALQGKEDKSNLVTSFQVTPDDTHYPSEKLVYDQLATKDMIKAVYDSTNAVANAGGIPSYVGAYHDSTKQDTISDLSTIRSNASTGSTHAGITSGNPHQVTKSDVGLGNVDNTADANKSVNYATTAGSAPANGGTATYATYASSSSNTGMVLRNQGLVSSDTTPSNNGEIYWTYS